MLAEIRCVQALFIKGNLLKDQQRGARSILRDSGSNCEGLFIMCPLQESFAENSAKHERPLLPIVNNQGRVKEECARAVLCRSAYAIYVHSFHTALSSRVPCLCALTLP